MPVRSLPRPDAPRRPAGESPVVAVLAPLPRALARELDTAEVAAQVERLVAAGWRPGQIGSRLAAAPSTGSVERDAAALRELLTGLAGQVPPDVAHAREVERRRLDRQQGRGPAPASDAVRERALAEIRASLKGVPGRRREPAPRVRPGCSLCGGEGSFFVTREVHLCRRCVAVLATGEARLTACG